MVHLLLLRVGEMVIFITTINKKQNAKTFAKKINATRRQFYDGHLR